MKIDESGFTAATMHFVTFGTASQLGKAEKRLLAISRAIGFTQASNQ
jgi:hypothetical protein